MTEERFRMIEEIDFNGDEHSVSFPHRIKTKSSNPNWRECSRCVLSISMGHNYHESAKLENLLYWASRNFNFVVLNSGDTLHRHNLIRGGMAPEIAHRAALRLGTEWLERNEAGIGKYLTRMNKIHRWSDWLFHSDFQNLYADIKCHYRENSLFRDAVHEDLQRYLNRRKDNMPGDLDSRKSTDYLLEEAAVFILVARTYEANRVYPAEDLSILKYLSNPDIPKELQGLDKTNHIHIMFHRKKSFQQSPDEQDFPEKRLDSYKTSSLF